MKSNYHILVPINEEDENEELRNIEEEFIAEEMRKENEKLFYAKFFTSLFLSLGISFMLLAITYINEIQYIKEDRQDYIRNQIQILIILMVISYMLSILGFVRILLYFYPKE
jgi:hypothetical protein